MLNNPSTPSYLSSLIPQSVGNVAAYGLRNSDHIRNIPANTNQFASSFLPSTISEWNKLHHSVRSSKTVLSFKQALNTNKRSVPNFYYIGNRESAVQHARLRMHCSSLNEHLFSKNIVESPNCDCGDIEDTYHYLFTCPLYLSQRAVLRAALSPLIHIDLHTLLFGNELFSDEVNQEIFHQVQTFIVKTKRFSS